MLPLELRVNQLLIASIFNRVVGLGCDHKCFSILIGLGRTETEGICRYVSNRKVSA